MFWFLFNFLIVAVPLVLVVLIAEFFFAATTTGIRSPFAALLDALAPRKLEGDVVSRDDAVLKMEKLAGVAVCALARIFEYGAILQEQDDGLL